MRGWRGCGKNARERPRGALDARSSLLSDRCGVSSSFPAGEPGPRWPRRKRDDRERGRSGTFISSKGAKFSSELPAQQQATDRSLRALRERLAGFDAARIGAPAVAALERATRAGAQASRRPRSKRPARRSRRSRA